MKKIKNYEINPNTEAIIGINKYSTKIVEKDDSYFIDDSSFSVMERSCEYFGSSFSGRNKGSKKMLGANYKVPIIVEESNSIIFFPLSEVNQPECMWISLNWFDRVEIEDGKTIIYFKNGKKIATDVSKYSVENQVLRSSKLHLILYDRKNPKNY